MRARLIVAAATLGLAACTASGGGHVPATSPSHSPVSSSCGREKQVNSSNLVAEVRGAGTASLYGLIMATKPLPVRVGEQVKIVWRMTGSGPLRLWASSPTGRRVPVRWGPDLHSSSNYHRPGDEWGAGYVFPTAGCWRLHAQRNVGHAVAPMWVLR